MHHVTLLCPNLFHMLSAYRLNKKGNGDSWFHAGQEHWSTFVKVLHLCDPSTNPTSCMCGLNVDCFE